MTEPFKFKLVHDHSRWEHSHNFAFGHEQESERRTFWVLILATTMTVVEIALGYYFNSIAVSADGWHMSTHAIALGIGYLAYRVARSHAQNQSYTFGTGKVHALGGYTSAVILAFVALFVAADSIWSLLHPGDIAFNEALIVAFVSLLVNLLSIRLLHIGEGHGHDHGHEHAKGHEHDINLKSAYAHVVVDAMTSVLAILALLGGKFMGWGFLDPVVGLISAAIIAQWSYSLIRSAMKMLLDRSAGNEMREKIKKLIEEDGDSKVADLHFWDIAPGRAAAIVSVVTHDALSVDTYKARLQKLHLAHVTVEVNQCERD
jgi:cation diffusion facilitator family transporter